MTRSMISDKTRGLTDLQKRLCEEYVIDLKPTKAAIRAGYSGKNITLTVYRVMAQANVQAYIEELLEARRERTAITADRVLLEFARIAFSDTRELFNEDGSLKDPHKLTDAVAAAVAGIEVSEAEMSSDEGKTKVVTVKTKKVKLWDKQAALIALARHLGMFPRDTSVVVNVSLDDLRRMTPEDLRALRDKLAANNR